MSSITPGGFGQLAYQPQSNLLTQTSVLTTSTQITNRKCAADFLTIQTAPGSTGNVWLDPSGTGAVVGQGACAAAGGGSFTFSPAPVGPVYAISDSGTVTISAVGA